MNTLSVNILLQKLAITVTVGSLLFSSPTVAAFTGGTAASGS
jgi:hypothetical protein